NGALRRAAGGPRLAGDVNGRSALQGCHACRSAAHPRGFWLPPDAAEFIQHWRAGPQHPAPHTPHTQLRARQWTSRFLCPSPSGGGGATSHKHGKWERSVAPVWGTEEETGGGDVCYRAGDACCPSSEGGHLTPRSSVSGGFTVSLRANWVRTGSRDGYVC
ncbi:uncharacterized protein Tco025E_10208, partial [Trypanosoma conorhini]